MAPKIVTIIGGTGFVGRYVVRLLAKSGYRLRVIARNPDAALPLKTAGDVGQIVLMSGNLAKPETLAGKLEDSFAVINLVGILFERGRQSFTHLHAQGAEKLAQMARTAGVKRFIHMSSLGVDKTSGSQYARSKMLGEKAIAAAFPQSTILRPSVIFGPEDNFFNQFAQMASLAPLLPLIGGGQTRFQPVYVGDIAAAVEAALVRDDVQGQMYELGGPQVYTLKEIFEYVLTTTGKHRKLLSVPFGIASAMGAMSELLPRPPLTRDQVKLLKHDNVVSPGAKTFAQLGISPTTIDIVVPDYLARFHRKAAA
jgi:uncharacterized protein YbjT (DUF2867 family)